MVRGMSEQTAPRRPGRDPEAGWFGDRAVDPTQKTRLVHGVFSNVAARYDLMNDLMSAGIHRLWKRQFVRMVRPRAGEAVLDVAGGTGDIAFGLIDAAGGDARVTICDLTESMVRVGRDRAIDSGRVGGLDLIVGNAEALPVADRSVDAYTIAFGLRNVTRIDAALAEARRVLKPGGRFFCLEFSHVVLPALARAYAGYSDAVIPRLGRWVAGDRDSYQYLVESIRRFPDQPTLARRMADAGLARPRWTNLSAGIAAVHQGWRI
jgi:demethylmenaquinone methyltransferase/2-methoxy-6-polyprenyl-1,4-benzoquinol methylase